MACLVAVVLSFRDGGYFVTSWGIASIVLWGTLVAALVASRDGIGGWPGRVAVAGLAAFALWQGASAWWAAEPAAAVAAMNLTLLYVAALAIGLVAAARGVSLAGVCGLVLTVPVVAAAAGVGARLLPDLVGGDDLPRLNTPVSYWNGLGALLALGVVLSVGLGASRVRLPARVAALAVGPLMALGLYLTLSRGAILLLGVALVALVALSPRRLEVVLGIALVGAASAVPVVMAARRDLTSLGSEPLPAGTGPRNEVVVALVVATLALVVTAVPALAGWGRVAARPRRVTGFALLGVVAVALVGGYAVAGPEEGAVSWADAQFEAFRSYGTGERNDSSVSSQLATAAGTGRWQNWSVAVDQFRDAPVVGTGAGDYRFRWNRERPVDLYVVNAHSLYLETLGESGLIGLVLLLVPLAVGVLVLVVAWVRRVPPEARHGIAVAACAALVIAVHSLGDWDWQLPAVMIPALVAGGASLRAASDAVGWGRPAEGLALSVTAGVAALAVVLLVAGPLASAARVDQARADARDGDLPAALAHADDAVDADPSNPRAHLLRAYVLTDLGRGPDADRAFAAALARSPEDWSVMADWAGSLISRREYVAARLLVDRAGRLNPREERVAALRRVLRDRAAR